MANNIFQTLQDLLKNPTSLFPKFEPPLLELLNNDTVKTPKLPLTGGALKSMLSASATNQFQTLTKGLLGAIQAGNAEDIFKQLKAIVGDLPLLAHEVEALLADQVIVGASLLSILGTFDLHDSHNLLASIYSAQGEYFFTGGYVTVADEKISPPSLATSDPKAFFSEKTGEHYIRDLTRVGLEAVANDNWHLITRYKSMTTNPAILDKAKAQNWFKGFADYSESSVTSAVEQLLSQNGGPVPANPLFAAGIATAAGTSARKAAQHTFLTELRI